MATAIDVIEPAAFESFEPAAFESFEPAAGAAGYSR
jgi:hypothetical protein